MKAKLSHAAIFARIGVPPSDADFEVVDCEPCGRQYLADHAALRVYVDPTDLSRSAFDAVDKPWPPCAGCGTADWGVVVADEVAPEWRWACRTDPLDRA